MLARGLIGFVTVALWLSVFLAGLTINSLPYRTAITEGKFGLNEFAITMATYTVTNAAILCLLSGVAGAMARATIQRYGAHRNGGQRNLPIAVPTVSEATFVGVLRSFVVYLIFISGVYIGANDAFGNTTPEQYARVVATTCLLAFLVSYNPALFRKVVEWFEPSTSPA